MTFTYKPVILAYDVCKTGDHIINMRVHSCITLVTNES
jgi:hypothetical protein